MDVKIKIAIALIIVFGYMVYNYLDDFRYTQYTQRLVGFLMAVGTMVAAYLLSVL